MGEKRKTNLAAITNMVNLVMCCAIISCDNVIKWKTYLITIVYHPHINSNVVKPPYIQHRVPRNKCSRAHSDGRQTRGKG